MRLYITSTVQAATVDCWRYELGAQISYYRIRHGKRALPMASSYTSVLLRTESLIRTSATQHNAIDIFQMVDDGCVQCLRTLCIASSDRHRDQIRSSAPGARKPDPRFFSQSLYYITLASRI